MWAVFDIDNSDFKINSGLVVYGRATCCYYNYLALI